MLIGDAPPLQTSGARLAGPPTGMLMSDTPITNAWRTTHRRLDRILKLFFIVDVFGTFIGVIYHDAWLTIVCLVAALSAGMIAMSERESFVVVNTTEDDEFINEKELVEAYVVARKFAEASNLLAATVLAVGFVIGDPWWSSSTRRPFSMVRRSIRYCRCYAPLETIERVTPMETPAARFKSSPKALPRAAMVSRRRRAWLFELSAFRSNDRKSLKIKMLEQALIKKVPSTFLRACSSVTGPLLSTPYALPSPVHSSVRGRRRRTAGRHLMG